MTAAPVSVPTGVGAEAPPRLPDDAVRTRARAVQGGGGAAAYSHATAQHICSVVQEGLANLYAAILGLTYYMSGGRIYILTNHICRGPAARINQKCRRPGCAALSMAQPTDAFGWLPSACRPATQLPRFPLTLY
jgi:hypothetical protein